MPDITSIPPPSIASGSDVGGKGGVNSAKSAQTDDTERNSQNQEVSFLDSFQQRLAAIHEQSEETETAVVDGNNLPESDEAAASFLPLAEQTALTQNAIPTAGQIAEPLQQTRGLASTAGVIQVDESVPAVQTDAVEVIRTATSHSATPDTAIVKPAEAAVAETDVLFSSRMLQLAADQPGDMATDRRALELLLAGGRSPADESGNALHTPAPMNTSTANAVTSVTGQTVLPETLGHPEWGQGLGRQMLWMVNHNMRSAEMRLSPANLGPIEVRIEMDDDQVSVAFNSRHAIVREALEQAIPRLREMFDANGMNLASTDISHQSFAEQHNSAFSGDHQEQRHGFASRLPTLDDMQAAQQGSSRQVMNNGLVDCYI